MELTAENIREVIRKEKAEAADIWAKAEKVKADIVASGADPLNDKDAFEKIDTAYKAYDLKADEIAQLEDRAARLISIGDYRRPSNGYTPRPSGGVSVEDRPRSMGLRFVESEQYQAMHRAGAFQSEAGFMAQMMRGFDRPIELMSRDDMEATLRFLATTVTGGGATSVGPFIQNQLMPGFVEYMMKRPVLASLVGPGTTDSDVVEYVSESAPTHAAAETAEDTAASESVYPFATNTTNVREITHFVPVTLRAMADAGQVRTIIESKIGAGVIDRLDTQLATGNGAGQNLTGIYNASSIGTQALGADTRLDAIHKAITTIRVAAGVLSEPDAIGFHPNDWEKIVLEKDLNGQYLMGPAGTEAPRTVWGVRSVVSTVFTSGTPLVGDYRNSATLWLREGLAVTTGLDGNDFTKRRVSILGAMRAAFAVTRAGGFTQVTGF